MTQRIGVSNSIPPFVILPWFTSLHLYKLLCFVQAVEILKTAREISMRVRFFPYSKCHFLFYLAGTYEGTLKLLMRNKVGNGELGAQACKITCSVLSSFFTSFP